MSIQFAFSGHDDRKRLLALGNVEEKERQAVERAKRARAKADILRAEREAAEVES